MSLPTLLESPPKDLAVELGPGEITIKTAMQNGPGKRWQENVGVAGMLLVLVGGVGGGAASWALSPEAFASLTSPLCLGLLLGGVLLWVSGWGRSGGPLTIRGNTLTATRYPVQLHQIQAVEIRARKVRNTHYFRYELRLNVGGKICSWSMPNATKAQSEWVGDVVRAAASEARLQVGTAAEIPAALKAVRSSQADLL